MQEIRPGLWTWTARHPDWTEEEGGPEGWGPEVRSYAYDSGACLALIDPLEPPSLVEGLIEGQDVAVLLTMYMHKRSAAQCIERFGATVYAPNERLEKIPFAARGYDAGEELPGGVVAQNGGYPFEMVLWIPAHRAIVAADALIGAELGLRVQPDSWLDKGQTHERLRASLRPLLELPIELILVTHGDPVREDGREALRAALDT
jgi:hypothetical protein